MELDWQQPLQLKELKLNGRKKKTNKTRKDHSLRKVRKCSGRAFQSEHPLRNSNVMASRLQAESSMVYSLITDHWLFWRSTPSRRVTFAAAAKAAVEEVGEGEKWLLNSQNKTTQHQKHRKTTYPPNSNLSCQTVTIKPHSIRTFAHSFNNDSRNNSKSETISFSVVQIVIY